MKSKVWKFVGFLVTLVLSFTLLSEGLLNYRFPSSIGVALASGSPFAQAQTITASVLNLPNGSEIVPLSLEEFEETYSLSFESDLSTEEYENMYLTRTELDDGGHQLDISSVPIRYQTEDGDWQFIDTSLVESGSGSAASYASKASPTDVQISAHASGNDDVASIEKESNAFSFKPVSPNSIFSARKTLTANKAVKYLKTDGITLNTEESSSFSTNSSYSSVKYEDVFEEGSNLVLTPSMYGIKEDIIFESLPSLNE